ALLATGLAVAVLSSAIPYSLELEALRRLPKGTFGVLMSLEPAVASLVGLVVLSQGLSATQALAVALVVAASAGALGTAEAPASLEACSGRPRRPNQTQPRAGASARNRGTASRADVGSAERPR